MKGAAERHDRIPAPPLLQEQTTKKCFRHTATGKLLAKRASDLKRPNAVTRILVRPGVTGTANQVRAQPQSLASLLERYALRHRHNDSIAKLHRLTSCKGSKQPLDLRELGLTPCKRPKERGGILALVSVR